MIQIAVCDDETSYVDEVEQILNSKQQFIGVEFTIIKFTDGQKLCEYARENDIDQLYLDIEMPGISGIEVARYVREELNNHKMRIIFMTETTQYYRQLFDFQTFGLLEKPICEEKLLNLQKTACLAGEYAERRIVYSFKGVISYINYSDILSIETQSHKMMVYVFKDKDVKVIYLRKSMMEMEQQMHSSQLLRISNSIIVNMDYIDRVEGTSMIMVNGYKETMSRQYKTKVKKAYIEYVTGQNEK